MGTEKVLSSRDERQVGTIDRKVLAEAGYGPDDFRLGTL